MKTLNLRNRISIVIAAICTGIVLFLGLMLYVASERMEEALVEQLLNEELSFFVEHHKANPLYVPVPGPNVQYYAVQKPGDEALVPEYARTLAPGRYEIDIGKGRGERDIAVHQASDTRYIVVYDIGSYEDREREFRQLMGASLLMAIGLAWLLGHRAAGILTGQLTQLAHSVERLRPEAPHEQLKRDSQDSEVATLALALDEYRLRMLEMVQREQEFTANASHELRTPLTAIGTSCDLLALDPSLSASARERTRFIRQAVTQMAEHVRVLLFLARGNEPMDLETVSLQDCVNDAAALLRDDIVDKGLDFEVRIPTGATLRANREALFIVVTNLLRNAVSYTEQGFVRVEGDASHLRVSDSGIGIDLHEISRIFERHHRTGSGPAGLGLGLHIVQRICARSGWRVSVSSVPSAGSVFVVSFVPASRN